MLKDFVLTSSGSDHLEHFVPHLLGLWAHVPRYGLGVTTRGKQRILQPVDLRDLLRRQTNSGC
jgi:hypothetical protein